MAMDEAQRRSQAKNDGRENIFYQYAFPGDSWVPYVHFHEKTRIYVNKEALDGYQFLRTRTRTYTNTYGTEASAAGRSGRACVARVLCVQRGGMGERGCVRRLGEWVWV